jgi:diguanylate cyclase (GGDEF)-like protein
MDSKIGLIIQLNGVFLITILSFFLRRSLKVTALKYWAVSWLCLSFALISLRLGFGFSELRAVFFTYYFLGEYLFGFLLVAGCRSLDGSYELKGRAELLFAPFIALAIALPLVDNDFNNLFNIHSIAMATFFALAFRHVARLNMKTFGWRVMYVALLLLFADFAMYTVIFTARYFSEFSSDFLSYNSVFDLVLETTLGFGMVIVLLERVLHDANSANAQLREAQHQLEILANTDPLTAAFNRHAFYGFVKKSGSENSITSGAVGFFDLDDLKVINDRYGHAAGDAAIRAVARAIREIIRAEDLMYRWGGDEFFVIMMSMNAGMAEERMNRLDDMLRDVYLDGAREAVDVGVSWGFRDFADASELEKAIKAADTAMYARKQQRKLRRPPPRTDPALFYTPSVNR